MKPVVITNYLPLIASLRGYNRDTMISDLIAGLIVTIMLIPQSLAYALLAGVPPEVGMYACILPLVAYAVFGTVAPCQWVPWLSPH
jgi:SulP family sulfate permease